MISNAWKTGSGVRVTAVHDEDYLRYGDQGNGEGNGNPLQCSSLESPRDRGAWWATVHGFTELDMTEQLTLSLSGKLIMNVKSTKDFCRNLW